MSVVAREKRESRLEWLEYAGVVRTHEGLVTQDDDMVLAHAWSRNLSC